MPALLLLLQSLLLSGALLCGAILYSIEEEEPPGTVFGVLSEDLHLEEEKRFRLMKPSGNSSLVRVRERDGQLSLGAARLDREALCEPSKERCSLAFDVVGLDNSSQNYRLLHVELEVLDVNDNAPALDLSALSTVGAPSASTVPNNPTEAPVLAYVSEAAPPDSLVALVSASDPDAGANGQVRCTLLAAPHQPFALQRPYDGSGGSYVVLTTGALDRERVPEYNLTLLAEDLGQPPAKTLRRLTVRLVDENDNPPRFARPRLELLLPENNPPGASLGSVSASDPDLGPNGKLQYRLLDGASVSAFLSLDPRSGALTALQSLDYEEQRRLETEVEACDGGSPRLCQQTKVEVTVLDVNDNPPRIITPALVNGSAVLPLPVGAPVGFLIARIEAEDLDDGANAELSFSILRAQPEIFAIAPQSGELYLQRPLPPDGAWSGRAVLVEVAVEDGGRPSLTSTAALRLLPTDALPPRVEIVSLKSPDGRPQHRWSLSMVLIAVLAGGCGLLLVAIALVAASVCRSRKRFLEGASPPSRDKAGRTMPAADAASAWLGVALDSPGAADASQAGGGSGGASGSLIETNVSRHTSQVSVAFPFHPSPVWEGDQSASSFSTHSTPDQLSSKDSGKGDSECNDSDSDVSREGLKKPSAEIIEKQVGAATFAKRMACRDPENYRRLQQSLRSKSLPFYYEHGGTVSCPATLIYGPLPLLRKTHFCSEIPIQREGCSPVQIKVLEDISENGLHGETNSTASSSQSQELNYPLQNSFSANVSEMATSF